MLLCMLDDVAEAPEVLFAHQDSHQDSKQNSQYNSR
jgi:hypothetical protein